MEKCNEIQVNKEGHKMPNLRDFQAITLRKRCMHFREEKLKNSSFFSDRKASQTGEGVGKDFFFFFLNCFPFLCTKRALKIPISLFLVWKKKNWLLTFFWLNNSIPDLLIGDCNPKFRKEAVIENSQSKKVQLTKQLNYKNKKNKKPQESLYTKRQESISSPFLRSEIESLKKTTLK